MTTVQDPNGNCTEHVYANAVSSYDPVEVQTIYQNGCNSTATTMRTVSTTYAADLGYFPGLAYGGYNTRPTVVATIAANGQTAQTQTDYETFVSAPAGFAGTWMNPTEIREYDFGASSPTRITDYTYLHNTGSSTVPASQYLANHIVDRLSTRTVSNSAGPILTTMYDYDAYLGGITPSKAYGRDTAYGNWGNATKKTITDVLAGQSYVSSFTYEDTGNMTGQTDPKGNVTTYSYADAWANATCALSCTQQSHIYLTMLTNAASEISTYSYNSCSGALASLTDPNKQKTFLQYDLLGRTTSINYPDGGLKTFSYVDGAPTSMTVSQVINPTTTKVATTTYDGLGRPTQTQVNDSSAADYVTTKYDGVGNIYQTSNPYRSVSDSTYGVTSSYFDVLNRKVKQVQPDQSVLYWCYDGVASSSLIPGADCLRNASTLANASWVDSWDEVGNHMQHVSDGLGRLRAVVEPDATSGTLAMETDYTYDALSNLLQVNQKGEGTDTARTRTFTYDGFSRLLCASNLESGQNSCPTSESTAIPSGVVKYTYDSDSNVSTKTDARGVITTYGYDVVNRLTSKVYSGNAIATATLPSAYVYGSPTSQTVPNAVGRLVSEYTGTLASPTSKRAITSYDVMGRIKQETQCITATGCSGTPFSFQYNYDLAGDVNVSTNGSSSTGIMLTSDYDAVGRLQTVTSSWNDAIHPGTLFGLPSTGTQYSAVGLSQAALGISASGQYTLQRSYDNRLRTIGETDQHTNTDVNSLSTGSIILSGAEKQVAVGTPATGYITITGMDGFKYICLPGQPKSQCATAPDTGSLTVTVNGFQATASYGAGDNDQTVAESIAAALNVAGSPVTATAPLTAPGNVVNMTSIATGPAADYAFSISGSTDFHGTDSGSALTGGGSGIAYDSGIVSVTVDGFTINIPWGTGSTFQSVASQIASSLLTADSSIVSAAVTTTTGNSTTINITSKQPGTSGDSTLSCSVAYNSLLFTSASYATSCNGMTGGTDQVGTLYPVYSYSIPSGGYAANGNLLSVSDSVMGNWAYTYDHLNRLSTAQASANAQSFAPFGTAHLGWSYDSFGNNKGEALSGSTGISLPQVFHTYSGVSYLNGVLQHVPGNNQMDGYNYDQSGNLLSDNISGSYTYDAEGRVATVNGTTSYLYDAESRRIAKQTASGSTVTLTNQYLLGLDGEQVSELDGQGHWLHTNAYAAGKLLATYDSAGLHFHFTDWLGSRRIQGSGIGSTTPEKSCESLPFGDDLGCTGSGVDATEHHFTGKERDTESGLDYFGARYYASSMGRWMSPDWSSSPSGVPCAELSDPQSLNLYNYMRNNPLGGMDTDGHWPQWLSKVGQSISSGWHSFQKTMQDGTNNMWNGMVNNVNAAGRGDPAAISSFVFGAAVPVPPAEGATSISSALPEIETESATTTSLIQANAAQGAAWEQQVGASLLQSDPSTVGQLRLQTQSGVTTVMDFASKDSAGSTVLTEAKSSATARLTPNQAAAHPEIAQTGAKVVGSGKPGYPTGTQIAPTKVNVVRPPQ